MCRSDRAEIFFQEYIKLCERYDCMIGTYSNGRFGILDGAPEADKRIQKRELLSEFSPEFQKEIGREMGV